jgi:hypothetical protein
VTQASTAPTMCIHITSLKMARRSRVQSAFIVCWADIRLGIWSQRFRNSFSTLRLVKCKQLCAAWQRSSSPFPLKTFSGTSVSVFGSAISERPACTKP